MPFFARHDGEIVNSFDLPEESFVALRGEPLSCPCCEGPMHIRFSEMGLMVPHFAHDALESNCESRGGVSRGHLAVQALTHAAIKRTHPWEAHIEFVGEDWRGDVVATRPDSPDAFSFEVQFSGIRPSEVDDRTRRHLRSGVRTVTWLCGRDYEWMHSVPSARLELPQHWDYRSDVPIRFRDLPGPEQRRLEPFSERVMLLRRFVGAILSEKLIAKDDDKIASHQGKEPRIVHTGQWLFQTGFEVENRVNNVVVDAIEAKERRHWPLGHRDDTERQMQEANKLQNRSNYVRDKEDVAEGIRIYHPDATFVRETVPTLASGDTLIYRGKRILIHPVRGRVSRETTPLLFNEPVAIVLKSKWARDQLAREYPGQLSVYSWEELQEGAGLQEVT